jgi:exodeoxyribonuclease VII large subunit
MRQRGFDFGSGPPRLARGDSRDAAPKAPARPAPAPPRRRALTVSELTDRILGVLETEFVDVWVEGEVSNLKIATSGHWYFSLKDEKAQLRAVVWKTDARLVRFRPQDGMKVVARGALRVYPPRGEYQLAVQVLEPLGKGSLQQAFEELKERLEREGLFDPARKRPLPMLPRRIGVVTSPTGAVLRDILRVLRSRYANLDVLVYPALVQGEGAAAEIAQGIRVLDRLAALPGHALDVIVVARGGGSLEDLWAFNEEAVARALAGSRVPTLSAVGHETDFTIADFVADLRAPTPSAAAERVVQAKEDLAARIAALEERRDGALRLRLARVRARVEAAAAHRVFAAERGRLHVKAQRVDELARRAEAGLVRRLERARESATRLAGRLEAFRLDRQLAARRERLLRHDERLAGLARARAERARGALARLAASLEGLSPLGVLGRGYALVWDAAGERLLRDAALVRPGDGLRIRLHRGALRATALSREEE